jgi:hypothetical protein
VTPVDDQFGADEHGTDEHGPDEHGTDGEGRLNLFGPDEAVHREPPAGPWDDEVDAGWDPSDRLDAWETSDAG